MDAVNKPDENGKILNLPYAKKQTLDESCKTGQTSGTKMTFYSICYNFNEKNSGTRSVGQSIQPDPLDPY
ncbi:hypothetical protein Hanom_Chr04g00308741 [Helianthus anomalus]